MPLEAAVEIQKVPCLKEKIDGNKIQIHRSTFFVRTFNRNHTDFNFSENIPPLPELSCGTNSRRWVAISRTQPKHFQAIVETGQKFPLVITFMFGSKGFGIERTYKRQLKTFGHLGLVPPQKKIELLDTGNYKSLVKPLKLELTIKMGQ